MTVSAGDCSVRPTWAGYALTLGDVPAIFPVNYLYSEDSIWFRTGAGVKLDAAEAGQTIAFEVDDVDHAEKEAWSVLVIGTPTVVTGSAGDDTGARVPILPWAPDPRDYLVRVRVAFVSGRRISQEHISRRPRE